MDANDLRRIREAALEVHMRSLIDRVIALNDWDALAEFRALVDSVPRAAHDRLARYLDERTTMRA